MGHGRTAERGITRRASITATSNTTNTDELYGYTDARRAHAKLKLCPAYSLLTILICLIAPAQPGCQNSRSTLPPVNGLATSAPARSGRPDDQQIVDKIREIVAKQLGVEQRTVDVGAPLSGQKVAADELDVVEIIMSVEEAFGVEIKDEEISGPDGDIDRGLSVNRLAQVVSGKKKAAGGQ